MPTQPLKTRLVHRRVDDDAMRTLLDALRPDLGRDVRQDALDALRESAESYRATFPIVETEGSKLVNRQWRSKGSLAKCRKELADFERILREAQEMLATMAYESRVPYLKAHREAGLFKSELAKAVKAAGQALKSVEADSDHASDDARVVLAMEVARVVTGPLGLKASVSLPETMSAPGRKGYAYYRVLRTALQMAGAMSLGDLRNLMKEGVALMKEVDEEDRELAEIENSRSARKPARKG